MYGHIFLLSSRSERYRERTVKEFGIKILHILGTILTVIVAICEIAEFLFVPALFVVIGLWNAFPWPYYVITIGGYFTLFAMIELVLHLIIKAFDKKYTPIIGKKLAKYFDRDKEKK